MSDFRVFASDAEILRTAEGIGAIFASVTFAIPSGVSWINQQTKKNYVRNATLHSETTRAFKNTFPIINAR